MVIKKYICLIVDNGDKDGFYNFRNAEDENKGYRAVTTKSFLICRHGEIIEPLDSGQVMLEGEENNQEKSEIEETANIETFLQNISVIYNSINSLKSFLNMNFNLSNGVISNNNERRVYESTHKHSKWGWGSFNPIPDDQIGQKFLMKQCLLKIKNSYIVIMKGI